VWLVDCELLYTYSLPIAPAGYEPALIARSSPDAGHRATATAMQCDNAEQVRHATQRALQEPTDSRPGSQSRGSYDDDVVVVTGLADMHGEISRTPRRCLYTGLILSGSINE